MLHVTNGDIVAEGITGAGLDGDTVTWRDVLHEGPLPAGLDAAELRAVRARFLAECGWGEAEEIEADLREREERVLRAQGRELIVLWFEHDLYDQLQLLQVVDMLDDTGGVSAILPDRFLGAMEPGELAELSRERTPITTDQLALARLAWSAVRAAEPVAVEAMLRTHTAALPHLAPALRRLLEELPAVGDGLARTERHALEAIAAGARTPRDAFVEAQKAEEAPFLGDTWMWRRLSELGQGDARLVQWRDGAALGPPPPLSGAEAGFVDRELELTATGHAVLAGEADRAELVPLDRWVGGTHVTGPRPAWRWDRAAQRSVSRNGGGG
ncbi:MAG: hypothetical protein QOH46_1411 [Solirubrobacteraceae bacterium]|jgi:hypothetical protein|nr:hypothetical protein [Solirubrobacteraceae bacterium]